MRNFARKTQSMIFRSVFVIAMLLVSILGGGTISKAAVLYSIEGNGIEGERLQLYAYGMDAEDTDVFGLYFNGNSMVPCNAYLQEQFEVNCTYDPVGQTIILEYYDRKLEMTVGNVQATWNGEAYTLPQAPMVGSAKTEGIQDVFVPASVMRDVFSFKVTETQLENGQYRVNMVPPVVYKEDKTFIWYEDTQIEEIDYNGESFDISVTMPGIVLDGQVAVPLVESIDNGIVNGDITIGQDVISISRGMVQMEIPISGTVALVNGNPVDMGSVLHYIQYEDEYYYMVPAKFLFRQLGAESVSVDGNKIIVKKSFGTYIKKTFENGSDDNIVMTGLDGKYKKTNKKEDLFVISCNKMPELSISATTDTITVTLKKTSVEQELEEKLYDTVYSQRIDVKQIGNSVKIIIHKRSGVKYVSQYGNGKVYIHVGITPVRIAVDCGHGSNTPGKRTPKMPCNIDFDGDGVIDVKKGKSILEHQMNVGVGKYLAAELERLGFQVYRSAFGSTDVSLSSRQSNIKKSKAKYSISVHFNAAGSGRVFHPANGVEVYSYSRYTKKSNAFAKKVLSEMIKGTKQVNRGAKQKRLAMCNTGAMGTEASILVECAFMSNLHEAKTMCGNSKFWKETGEEIAKATCEYASVTYIEN